VANRRLPDTAQFGRMRVDDAVMTDHWRTSRFARSALTFGGPGRLLATILFLSPIYLAFDLAGVFGILFVLVYAVMVVPQGLRWLWQPARVELIVDPLPLPIVDEPPPAGSGIADRQAPSRW
jgi:hypothetical protein